MKVAFPHMGHLWVGLKAMLERLGVPVLVPPRPSRRTLELGARHAPEFACLPLKVNLGGFIEALEAGADTIVQAGGCGPCRFGYYAQVQRRVLEGLGYRFDMITLEPPSGDWAAFREEIGRLTHGAPALPVMRAIGLGMAKIAALDRLDMEAARLRPHAADRPALERALAGAPGSLDQAQDKRGIWARALEVSARMEQAAGPRPRGLVPLRVALVGEIFVVLEPFVNYEIERRLGALGVEVERTLHASRWAKENVFPHPLALWHRRRLRQAARPYLGHFVGGDGLESVGHTVLSARRRLDGVIQLNPFTCMPETVARAVMERAGRELDLPVLSLTIDEHTGEAGFQTRLEAFVDLLERRRRRDRRYPVQETTP